MKKPDSTANTIRRIRDLPICISVTFLNHKSMNNKNKKTKWTTKKTKILFFVSLFFLFFSETEAMPLPNYAQKQSFTINFENKTIQEVFTYIEHNSEFVFLFYADILDTRRKVNVSVKNESIQALLNQILNDTPITYEIKDRQIILVNKAKQPVQETPSVTKTQEQKKVTGKVVDETGEALPGVAIQVKGTPRGVSTDIDGSFSIDVKSTDVLIFSCIGMEDQSIAVENKSNFLIKLHEKSDLLDEVTVVAFAKQKKESVIASISTVKPSELRVPSSNLTTSFAGKIAGVIAYQRTGEPGEDNAQFFIRGVTSFGTGKVDPLILIDGVEMTTEDLSRITTDDIASFSIMKDANATALYGARGANGVILVTTKEGHEGVVRVQFRAEGAYSSPTEQIDFSDPVTYMKLHNNAVQTRRPGTRLPYDEKKINYTERGIDPVRYPANDWQNLLFDKNTFNQRYNLNISGGGKTAHYYIAASYTKDNGIIKMDKRQNFNNNISIRKYSLRSNINVNLTKTTEAIVRLSGVFDDQQGPLDGGTDLYNKAVHANPVYFLPFYEPDAANMQTKHILFGNTASGTYLNPYADMLKGYKSNDRSSMYVQFELKQNLDFITEGLSARGMFNINRFAQLEVKRQYKPFFYTLSPNIIGSDDYILEPLNPDNGTDYLDYVPGGKKMENTMYFEGALQYSTTIAKKHSISGLMVFTLREKKNNSYETLQLSLPSRNLGLAGRATYSYEDRYFVEVNFGYNGSERFSQHERWGFFPSAGLGWIVSNEAFMKPCKDFITKLKLKATYGLVGNDEIGDSEDRFYYLSNLNMSNGDRGISFGDDYGYNRPGISISRYEDPYITWEISRKSNFGLELNIKNSLELQVDYFMDNKSQILQKREDVPTTMGLQATPKANIGKAAGRGVEISVDYNKSFNKNLWAIIRGNFTYATNEFRMYEEPDYSNTPWRSHMGQKIKQQWGYVAERLFLDEEEVKNSPVQAFGEYGAGDIKYKDINMDGRIDENDQVPIGYPTDPEIIYGFGLSLGYKSFDFSCFFQGSAHSAFWISPDNIAPFVSGKSEWGTTNRALLQTIADDHWSENNRNVYAFWPRLSAEPINNNNQKSTWWMRDGSFLRLKNIEVGYTFPKEWVKKCYAQNLRLYASASNVFQLRKFKMWDPEQAGNAFNYPLQRVINFGVSLEF